MASTPSFTKAKSSINENAKKIFKRDSAYNQMTSRVPTLSAKENVADARDMLFRKIKEFDSINYIYVLSSTGRLAGVVSIKELFRSQPNVKMSKLMNRKVSKVHQHTDRERVAHQALRENIKAMPVVDDNNKFLGVVVSDKILHILHDESQEDLLKMSGMILGKLNVFDILDANVISGFLSRTPWIVVGLLGGLLTAHLISLFEHVLERKLILASFIPLVAYVANAVGTQTQTIFIRGLAKLNSLSISDFAKYLSKQVLTTALIGIVCWVLIYLIVVVVWASGYIGFVVGLSVFIAIVISTVLALTIPYLLHKTKQDPAIGAGPFATTLQDFLSVLIYFLISSVLI
jgi:magnesium transporter